MKNSVGRMYWITPLINGSLMALFIVIFVVAGRLSNAFHVHDIATNAALKRDVESLLMSSAISTTDHQHPQLSSPRSKRYTNYQETALSICCGVCMYRLRTTYSICYDLCNWNGRSTSPWQRYDSQQQQQQKQQASVAGLKTNDIHRMLTPRVGQRKTDSTGGRGGKASSLRRRPGASTGSGRRRMRINPGRKGGGRRRNTGARRKTAGNETCTCPCQS